MPFSSTVLWRGRAGLAVLSMTVALGMPTGAGAQSTEDQLTAARTRLEQLERESEKIAERYAEAYARSAELGDRAVELEARIAISRTAARSARRQAQSRAIELYSGSTGMQQAGAAFDATSAMDAARRDVYTGVIADRDVRGFDRLRATSQDLASEEEALQTARQEQDAVVAQLAREIEALDSALLDVQALREELQDELAAEEAAARRAAALRAAAEREAAARRVADERAAAGSGGGSGDAAAAPPDEDAGDSGGSALPAAGNLGVGRCPISGAVVFTDTWGDPRSGGRSHKGVDLLSPAGTPNVAVTSGRVEQDYGARQGNGVFLYGDNGNTYYYFHLSAYAGPERRVEEGEIIGYVGSTGASGANHTHFEIHPGGGSAVNPYPFVRSIC